jgi:hypothetical protein
MNLLIANEEVVDKLETQVYNLDCVPNEEVDLRYCIMDCTDKTDIDYFFVPLIFLESFYAPAIVLNIAGKKIQMPIDWSMMVCDEHFNDVEIIPLTQLNDRGFKTPVYNPMSHMVPESLDVEITNVYAEVKWFFPKLKNGYMLPVPLDNGPDPRCVMFVKEANKIPDPLDAAQLFS